MQIKQPHYNDFKKFTRKTQLTKPLLPDAGTLPELDAPVAYRILVHPLPVPEEQDQVTSGGIIFEHKEIDEQGAKCARQFGIIVAMGEDAFREKETGDPMFKKMPKIGDPVIYFRFAGSGRTIIREQLEKGPDGDECVVDYEFIYLNDSDIATLPDSLDGYRLQ